MQTRRHWQALRLAIVATDASAIALAFIVASLVYPGLHAGKTVFHPGLSYAGHIVIYTVGWLALLAMYRLYDPEYLLDGLQQYTRIAQASTVGLLILGLVALLDGSALASRFWLLTSWLLSILLLALTRFAVRRQVRHLRKRGMFRSRILIVGAGEEGLAIAEQIASSRANGTEVVGFLDEYSAIGDAVGSRGEVLGEPLALAHIAQRLGVTEAIIVPQSISWESLRTLVQGGPDDWNLQQMWLAPAFRDLLTTGMEVHQRGSLPLLSVTGPRITGLEAAFKRGLDIGLVVATLPVTLLLSLGIVVWLAAVQHVAPLASHRVIGRNRREFTLLTFAPTPALQHFHLWRLPALLNVLIGELSLVGPRPIARSFGSEYRPWSLMLASVRPGLTGPWWLLSGSVGSRSVETEVGLDLAYIRSYTIWLDVRLLALTARHLLAHSGETHTAVIPAELSRIATPDPTGVRIGGLL